MKTISMLPKFFRRILWTRPTLSYAAGIITVLVGLVVLIGWQFNSYTLETFALGGVSMKPNTAISFLLAGLSLILLQRPNLRINNVLVRLFATVIVSLGLLTLYQYVFAINLGIDEFLFHETKNAIATVHPGRMAPNTSLNFVLVGLVLFAFSFRKFKYSFSLWLPLIFALCVSVIGLLGYITGLTELAGLPSYTKMAFNTSATFIILCSGIIISTYKDQKTSTSVERKLFTGLTVTGSLIIFVSIISITSIQSFVDATGWVKHTQQVKEELGLTMSEVYEMVANGRGFLISGDEKYLEQWNQAKENIPKIVNGLSELTRDNPKQQELLISLNQLVKERIDFSRLLINIHKTKGREAANTLFATLRGKKITDGIDTIISQMTAEENRLLNERDINEFNHANRTKLIILLSIGVQVLLLAFIFVFVKQDLSGRRKAEAFLQESEVKFKAVFENSPIGKSLTTIDGKLRVNKEFCNIVGYSEEELSKLHWKEITHPDDIDESQMVVSSLLAGEKDHARYQKRYVHKSGNIVWTDISTFLQRDKNGKPLHFITSINDITERKRYEKALLQLNEELEDRVQERTEALLENEARLLKAQQIAHLGFLDWDLKTNEIFCSDEVYYLYGIDLSEKPLSLEKFSKGVHLDDWEYVQKNLELAIRGEKEYNIDHRIIRTDGEVIWVHAQAELVIDEKGNPSSLLGTILDITERKKAEEEIKKSNRVYAVLSNINQAIVRVKDKQKLFDEACRITVEDGKFRMAWIGMIDQQTNKIIPVASAGLTDDYLKTINIDLNDEELGQGPTGRAIKSGVHYFTNDIDNKPEMIPWRENALKLGYKSSAAFPIKVFGKTVGAFILYSDEAFFFDEAEIKLLDELAMDISFAIEFNETETKRKLAEENLRESELKFRSVWEKGTDGMRITNEEGIVVLVNDAYCKMVEKPREEIEGKPMSVVFEDAKQAEALRKHQERFRYRSIPHYLEKDIVLWNGRRISLELSNTLLEIPHQPTLSLSVFRDITERKKAEEIILQQAESLKAMLSTIKEGFLLIDDKERILDVNNSYCKMSGYTKDELLKMTIPDIEAIETYEEAVGHTKKIVDTGYDLFESKHRTKNSKIIDVENSVSYWATKNQFFVFIHDITKRKQAEINLKRREAILETISISAEKFLTAKNINEPINDTLRLLCKATDASRVYIYKFHNSGDGKLLTSQTHEYVKQGIAPQIDNPELQNLDLISAGYKRWVESFEKHKPIVGLIKDFPDSEIEILRAQDIQSIVVTPIYMFKKLYGFIGFDECLYERSWSKPEIEALQAVANLIAGAIVREENRKELVENEKRLRSIINSTPLGSHVYEIIEGELILIDANSSANMILGVDHRKLKNKNIKDIFPLIGFSSIADEFKNVATTGKSFTKDYIISGEGLFTGIFEFFAFQIKKNSMALFFRDVSEQKKLELRIQKSEERFKLASQATHDSIWDRDLLTNKVWWSENMNKIFDLNIGNKETDIKKWYELLHPADLQRVEAKIKEGINSGQDYWSDEYRLLRGDGKYAFVLDRGYIIRDKYKKPIRMVGSILDYTEKVRHEQDLIAAKEKAEEANRLKSGFISAMSHEIRTPLNIILGYNDLIKDMYSDPANEEIQVYFNSITNNGSRLIDTITKILDISRIEAGEFPISLQPIPIKEIIDRTYYSMKILAEKKKLRLVFNPLAENISVLADTYCLENSLINLVNNAIKYSEKGRIEISLKKENKFAVCKIKDEGIGMSESYQKHLFQTFSQEKVGISRPYEGVGLGLALTKKYAERMQATIEIQSKQGSGTTVTLKIPLAK